MTCNSCKAIDDILPSLGEAFKADVPPQSLMARSSVRSAALEYIRSTVGKGIYWGRRVEPSGNSAIRLRTLSSVPLYDLIGEISTIQPSIEVTVFTKGTMPIICSRIISAARVALSGYRGTVWDYNQNIAYIHGATVLREQSDPYQLPVEAGGYWAFAASYDIQVTYDRITARETCDGLHR